MPTKWISVYAFLPSHVSRLSPRSCYAWGDGAGLTKSFPPLVPPCQGRLLSFVSSLLAISSFAFEIGSWLEIILLVAGALILLVDLFFPPNIWDFQGIFVESLFS